jgi:hypothetical protein
MDILVWLVQKITTECGALGAAGWGAALWASVLLAKARDRYDKLTKQVRDDLIEQRERAERRADAIAILTSSMAEIRGRLAIHGDDC